MHKFKGQSQKRYYRKLLNLKHQYNFEVNDWYDLHHIHVDFGYGNLSWKHRKSHLIALFELFNDLKEKFKNRIEDYQIFCRIILNDSRDDALYIHTKNPNENNFPIVDNDYMIDFKIPSHYVQLLDQTKLDWYKISWYYENEPYYGIIVYDKNYGVAIN